MTQQEVFNIAVDLMSERLDSGLVDTNSTLNYTKRAPGLLTNIQSELCREVDLYNTITLTETTETDNGYRLVTLPSDYISIYQIVDSNLQAQADYKIIGDTLYVPYELNGTIIYRYSPTTVTALSETTPFKDFIAKTIIANMLASALLITENASLANYFSSVALELRRNIKIKQPASIGKRTDKYDASCKF